MQLMAAEGRGPVMFAHIALMKAVCTENLDSDIVVMKPT